MDRPQDSWKSKRCLIPTDGFYEWTKAEDGGKDPWFIHIAGSTPFSFAGLWARNDTLDIIRCTIIIAPAAEPVSQLHDRMPVILDPDFYDKWLSPDTQKDDLKSILLSHNLDGQLSFTGSTATSTRQNSMAIPAASTRFEE